MTRHRWWLPAALAAGLVCAAWSFASDDDAPDDANADKVRAAVAAAEQWLALVDEGKSDESWRASAELLRRAVTTEQWAQALRAAREPLGKLVSRKTTTTTYATTLPGAPDGQYVVIQFAVSFDNKREGVETVTPMLEKDGKWRVSGYFIK